MVFRLQSLAQDGFRERGSEFVVVPINKTLLCVQDRHITYREIDTSLGWALMGPLYIFNIA